MKLRCGSRSLDLSRPVVMGVLNVTPDSFSDAGRYGDPAAAISHALRMVDEGAAIVDIGGESTRPGAADVSVQQQLDRVIPVIERLAGTTAVISVDTSRPEVMRAAVDRGAGLLNDIRAFQLPGALETAAASGAALCLMHMQGEPRTMQIAPAYGDVVTDIKAFLGQRVQACGTQGIGRDRIVVDPGFGFGKTVAHNLALLRRLDEFAELGLPVLVGLSRKSMIGALTGRAVTDRLHGSLGAATIAVLRGARIVRAHDVAATVDAVRVASAMIEGDQPE